MKKSEIHFDITLDENSIPDKIFWDATDNPNDGLNETKAIAINVWDNYHKGTLSLPLWTKDMEVHEMKRFYIEVIGSAGDTLRNATGDNKAADLIEELCIKLTKDLQAEMKAEQAKK
jgi:gliding motility-associated protein GldC